MTTKILSGKYPAGYALKNTYAYATVTGTGSIQGAAYPASGAAYVGTTGGVGLKSAYGAVVYNLGFVQGGMGGPGSAASAVPSVQPANHGGTGGTGIFAKDGGVANYATIIGGAGGAGGAGYNGSGSVLNSGSGGAGGVGLQLSGNLVGYNAPAANTLTSMAGVIRGGVGGTGGAGSGFLVAGGAGGTGGTGVILGATETFTNKGDVYGGKGGLGGSNTAGPPGRGGRGGTGVAMTGGVFDNSGYVVGGSGGAGSVLGVSGDGADLSAGATFVNSGVVSGFYGVLATGAATVNNYGRMESSRLAVEFTGTGGRLIEHDGARMYGDAQGAAHATLEMDSTPGTITRSGDVEEFTGSVGVYAHGFGTYQLDNGGWTLAGYNLFAAGFTLDAVGAGLTNTGTLTSAGTIEVTGLLSNSGAIALASGATLDDLRFTGAAATLGGGGTVTLSGTKARIFGATAATMLTNIDNTIAGGGFLGVGLLTLANESKGVIDATGSKQVLSVDLKGVTSSNAGLMEASTGATLALLNATLDQTGGGTITALTGGRVDLEGSTIEGGSLIQAGTGVLSDNVNGTSLIGKTQAVSLTGSLLVSNGVTLTLDGAIVNAGKIDTFGVSTMSEIIVGADGVSLSGGGQINLFANANNEIIGAASGDTLTNVDNRIAGAGQIGGGTMTLVNQAKGVIAGTGSVTLTVNTGTKAIQNAGTIDSGGTGQVTIAGAVSNTGRLFAASGTLNLDGAVTGAGIGQIKNGVLNIAAAFGETVTFVSGATGTLRLTDYKDFTGKVSGLSATGANSIQIAGMPYVSGKSTATYSGTTASGVLTISNGTITASVTLTGDYLGHTFTVSNGGGGMTTVKDPPASASSLAHAMAAQAPAASWSSVRTPYDHSPPRYMLARP